VVDIIMAEVSKGVIWWLVLETYGEKTEPKRKEIQ